MEGHGENPGGINKGVVNENELLKRFKDKVCRKDKFPCLYWNNGCTLTTKCPKKASFLVRERVKATKIASAEQAKIKEKKLRQMIPRHEVKGPVEAAINFISQLDTRLCLPFRMKADADEVIHALKSLL